MDKYLDGWDLAAHVRFMRQTHKGSFILVEGAWDDRVFSRFVDSDRCSIEVSFGKSNAIEALNLLEEDGFEGIVAIVDMDFDGLDGVDHQLDGLIVTDHHDLDLTILLSPALSTFLDFRADPARIKSVANGDLSVIVDLILKAGETLGHCRWLSSKHDLMLDFKNLNFEFINQATLECDDVHATAEIISKSPAAKCNGMQLGERLRAARAQQVDLKQLVCGHDATTVLGIALRQMLATRPKPQTWRSEIEAGLRMAFDYASFQSTNIYSSLRQWEANNDRYKILRAV